MLYVMCGPSGSGKSTWANFCRLMHPKAVIVSTDDIREELFSDASCQDEPEKVFRIAYDRVESLLNMNYDVVLDAMNITKNARKQVLARFKKYEPTCVVVNTSLEDCIKRQESRDRKVSEDLIRRMFERFTKPSLEEGWKDIIEI